MSDVPLANKKLIVAKPLAPNERLNDRGAAPAGAVLAPHPASAAPGDAQTASPVVAIDVENAAVRNAWTGRHGLLVSLSYLAQLFVQEAPAWLVSMVVHMVTLVTMAMITVPEPAPYKPQHLIVSRPEKKKEAEKVQEIKDVVPQTLKETEVVETSVFDTDIDQAPKYVEPTSELEAAPAAVEISEWGVRHVPPGDMLALSTSASGSSPLGGRRTIAGDVNEVRREGGSKASEVAVHKALQWLANHQLPDGGWCFDLNKCPSCKGKCRDSGSLANARNAATGLALLAYLGAGQTHEKSGKYRSTVHRGLQYLLARMKVNDNGGSLYEPKGTMYSHGIGAIAICEAYAMTRDRALLNPTRMVLGFICYAQDPIGGGWRYWPRNAGDTSVVGWQLMALKSGYMAGFDIPPDVVERTSMFLDSVQANGGAAYGYMKPGQDGATTSIGLLCRMYLGWRRDNPALERGVRMLSKSGPSPGDMYYNYYATQVMRHWEGEPWENWNRQMRDHLVHHQDTEGHEEGSWFVCTDADRGKSLGGRLYCTAMATMILEVYYRHMPIYRSESTEQEFPD